MKSFVDTVASMKQAGGFFASASPVTVARAPGRLDLMGGNVDYTGGLVFQATIREATWAAVQLAPDGEFHFYNPQAAERGWHERVVFSMNDLASEDAVHDAANREPGTCGGPRTHSACSITCAAAIRNDSPAARTFSSIPKSR